MRLADMDRFTALLTDYLDIQSRRAEIVAGNLANADTPEYRAKELEFGEYLRTAVQNVMAPPTAETPPPLLDSGLRVVEQADNVPGVDGNTVDLGREMATLAEAGGKFMAGTHMLQARFRALRLAIREGR